MLKSLSKLLAHWLHVLIASEVFMAKELEYPRETKYSDAIVCPECSNRMNFEQYDQDGCCPDCLAMFDNLVYEDYDKE
jgi:uncharacterized CHY-type Zn-finger protein